MSFAAQLAVLAVVSLAVLTTFLDYQTHRGLLWGWQTTFGRMLLWLHDHAQIRIDIPWVWHHTVEFGGVFGRVNNRVVGWLQDRLKAAEHDYALSVHALEATWHATVISIEWLAHETAATFDWLVHTKFPAWAEIIAAGALPIGLVTKLITDAIRKASAHSHKEVKAAAQAVPATIVRLVPYAIPAAIPGVLGLPKIRAEIRGLTKRNLRLSKRLHRVEGLFGVAVMAAAMANVLGLPNWRCLTRGNVGKVARRLCGLSAHALDDILGLLVDVFILTNICNAITLMEDGLGLIQGPLTAFIDTAEAQFVHCDYQLVGPLPDVPLSLPTYTGLVLSLP